MTAPGWYPDPNDPTSRRYFDGTAWTESRAPVAADAGFSTRSAAVAGLLQLFLGWFGIGRFYIGSPVVGVIQLALGVIGIFTTIFLIGFFILGLLSLWTVIEAFVMFGGGIRDGDGKKLR